MSFVISVGRYGGFHFTRTATVTVLCLGWVSFEVWWREVADTLSDLLDRIENHSAKEV